MRRSILHIILLLFYTLSVHAQKKSATVMMFGDTTRVGVPFAKDPHVVKFGGRYLLYYSIPPYKDRSNPIKGWGIGIAESSDLTSWKKIGEITPDGEPEKKGLAAPCALVIGAKVH